MNKKGPVPIGTVVADILARKGLGRQQARDELDGVWERVISPTLAGITLCGQVRRNQLDVIVTNSTVMQELVFRKQELINSLNQQLPQQNIKDIRFRVGSIQQKKAKTPS